MTGRRVELDPHGITPSPNALRVIVLAPSLADPAARAKLRVLAGLGCSVAAAVPDRWEPTNRHESFQPAYAEDGGVRIVPIPVRGADELGTPRQWSRRSLRRLLTDFRPDLVHLEEEPGSPVAALLARLVGQSGPQLVLHPSESVARRAPLGERRRRSRSLGRAGGLVGATSAALALVRHDRPDLPYAVIPRAGIQPPRETPRDAHTGFALGFVGRLVPEKGLDLLLRACVKLYGDWTLTVAGSGPAQPELEALAEHLGIAARITWLGAIPWSELGSLWRRLDCVVQPSRTTPEWVEVYPQPILEAMSHGLPVVVTRSGALPEMVGEAGLVVPEDDVAALTAALATLQRDPSDRQRRGDDGRRRVLQEFVEEAIAQRLLHFWRGLSSRRTTAATT